MDGKTKSKPYRDEEWLRQKYAGEKLSMNQIADICDCSVSTIKLWIDKHGIEPRSRGLGVSIRAGPLKIRTQDTGHEVAMAWHNWVPSIVYIHRLCAVAWFGWDAVRGKQVHHENGNPWDNREENLACLTEAEHKRLHVERGDNLNRDNHG